MPIFETHYMAHEFGTATQLWARDEDHARELCRQRGMGESYGGLLSSYAEEVFLPSEWLQKGEHAAALHSAMWLGMVAIASKTVEPLELLIDGGIIHELSHLIEPTIQQRYGFGFIRAHADRQLPKLVALEGRVPGFDKRQFHVPHRPPPKLSSFFPTYSDTPTKAAAALKDITENFNAAAEKQRARNAQMVREAFDPQPRRAKR